ncbi:MAG: hypothetical protein JO326_00925 [Acetobacteraceae bacterium]|nr:hypothetical protein [Acetobacteraceae bacterium]
MNEASEIFVDAEPVVSSAREDAVVRRIAAGAVIGCIALAVFWWRTPAGWAALHGLRLLPALLGALLTALAALCCVAVLERARRRGPPAAIGRAARWPQVAIAVGLGVAAIAASWLKPAPHAPAARETVVAFGAAALVLSFPVLLAERFLAATPSARLPEAPDLRRLLLLTLVVWVAGGLATVASGIGVPWADRLPLALALLITVAAGELALRAAGRAFLPPPAPEQARAAVRSATAAVLAQVLGARRAAAPVRRHLGVDFSRSWALAFVRAAALPVALGLAVLAWGLSGIVLLPLDARAVYERFGAPVAVLHPGLHAILPWPLGRARRVEYGAVHETSLAAAPAAAVAPSAAEAPPPAAADRLWEQPHPGEQTFLIASAGPPGRDNFQVVSADLQLRWRVGMTDAQALRSIAAIADPEAVLRAASGRLFARYFAAATLDAVLGGDRERMAADLRAALQQRLDALRSGLEVSAVVIEAIHPPAGAAASYHAVQSAEIAAATQVSAERGRAIATLAKTRQYATDTVTQSQAAAAEIAGQAHADAAAFAADFAAAGAHGDAFLLERRLDAVATGLAKSALTIVDHRIPAAAQPTLDLRTQTPLTAGATGSRD